ncbi:MAG: acyltransferase [Bacteroidales bacterium]|nr:acyltransferase [Bacteroidales bacterium]
MDSSRNRIFAVDWMKGVMITIIVLHHFFCVPGFNHTYLPVDFFFFISGYFLMNGFSSKRTSAFQYTAKRISKFYPAVLVCFILSCIIFHSRLDFSSLDAFVRTVGAFSFLLTLTNGLVTTLPFPVMDVTWFLSILVIAGFLIYALLDYDPKLACTIVFPLVIIFGYTLIFSQDASIQSGGIRFGFNLNLVRGFCDMSFGALICQYYSKYKESVDRKSTLFNMLFILATVLFGLIMVTKECHDLLSVVLLPFITLGLVMEKSWINSLLGHIRGGLFSVIGRYSFEILIIHQLVMIVFYKLLDIIGLHLPFPLLLLLDFIIVLFLSFCLRKFSDYLSSKLKTA